MSKRVEDILHRDLLNIIIDYHQDIKFNQQEVIKELKYKFRSCKVNSKSWSEVCDIGLRSHYFSSYVYDYTEIIYVGFKYLFNRITYKSNYLQNYSIHNSEHWQKYYDYNLRALNE